MISTTRMTHPRTFAAAIALSVVLIAGYSGAQTVRCTTWNFEWFPNGSAKVASARLVVGARSRELSPEALGAFLQFPVQIGRDVFQSNVPRFETVTVPFRFSLRRAGSDCFSMTN